MKIHMCHGCGKVVAINGEVVSSRITSISLTTGSEFFEISEAKATCLMIKRGEKHRYAHLKIGYTGICGRVYEHVLMKQSDGVVYCYSHYGGYQVGGYPVRGFYAMLMKARIKQRTGYLLD